jgi:uncharacterized damage-inducible protein DinB
MMTHALHDPIRHNAWATARILSFCRGLDERTLNTAVPSTYGTIIATLPHLIFCEIEFVERLLGRELSDPWRLGEMAGLDTILGAHGHEPPDLTPWAYAVASGRMRA